MIAQFWFRLRSMLTCEEEMSPLYLSVVRGKTSACTELCAIRQGSLELPQAFLDEWQAEAYPL